MSGVVSMRGNGGSGARSSAAVTSKRVAASCCHAAPGVCRWNTSNGDDLNVVAAAAGAG